jgi:hypothetical protein
MRLFKPVYFDDEILPTERPAPADFSVSLGLGGPTKLLNYRTSIAGTLLVDRENSGRIELPLAPGAGMLRFDVTRDTGKTKLTYVDDRRIPLWSEELSPPPSFPNVTLAMPSSPIEAGAKTFFTFHLENIDLVETCEISFFGPSGKAIDSRLLVGQEQPPPNGAFEIVFPEAGKGRAQAILLPNQPDIEPITRELAFQIVPNSGLSLSLFWVDPFSRLLGWKSTGYKKVQLIFGTSVNNLPAEGYIHRFPLTRHELTLHGLTEWGKHDIVALISEPNKWAGLV